MDVKGTLCNHKCQQKKIIFKSDEKKTVFSKNILLRTVFNWRFFSWWKLL